MDQNWLSRLPKTDIHLHQEADARYDLLLAQRDGRQPFDWAAWRARLQRDVPPGYERLATFGTPGNRALEPDLVESLDQQRDWFVAKIADVLREAARDNAVLVEVMFGAETVLTPGFMERFNEAKALVQREFPALHAQALIAATRTSRNRWLEVVFPACLAAAKAGLAGLHFIPDPYHLEAPWGAVNSWASEAAAAGLGLAAHAGEFSEANLLGVLGMPGLSRIGHAVYAAKHPRILEALATRGVSLECSLTCNVVLGAVESLESHPLRKFVDAGVAVTLTSDNPVRMGTSIGREYAIAAGLGFSEEELRQFTSNGILASFAPDDRKVQLMALTAGGH